MRLILVLLAGCAGGAAATLLHVPAPWLAGSMMAGLALMGGGVRVEIPDWLRRIAFVLLGICTGAAANWDTVARAGQWPLSIGLLGVSVIAMVWASFAFYRRVAGWDRGTALFASLPGALSLVLALADEAKADMRRVTVAQSVRLFFLITVLPLAIELMSPVRHALPAGLTMTWQGILLLVALASIAGLLFERLKVPAGLILGALLASLAAVLAGLAPGALPAAVLIPANVVLGLMIASRFGQFSLGDLRSAARHSFGGFLAALAVSLLAAGIASHFGGFDYALALLAFSPGGLEAMLVMAFALQLDPAYVAAHQLARYLGLALFMPAATAWIIRRGGA